ncbi:MAG: T9SS type A sorting domain-containing protein [Bacteroidales bacterium]|nr:T9SS type A sorting domain-containing protein [Bacteroidales bacterium]
MKKLTLIIVLAFLIQVAGFSQPCLPEGITFTTQAEIDSFQINHPDCTEIEGDVEIGSSNINNLNGLNVLTSFGGNLKIGYTWIGIGTSLVNLTGLENVTSIGGSLLITENTLLTSLSGLDNLSSIGGFLEIRSNEALTSLTGFNNVTSLGGDLVIRWNEVLASLSGLDNIDAGSIVNLSIYSNPALSSCEVQSICDYLVSPNGFVNIYLNTDGCDNPAEVANTCGNTMPCLPFGNYNFVSQSDIDNFQANYPGCTELQGDVIIGIGGLSGTDITNLNGLDVITSIAGRLVIGGWWGGNPALTSLTGLDGLTYIGSDLFIMDNENLSSLSGLENLTTIDSSLIIGRIEGAPNSSLTSLAGLDNLETVGGNVEICRNSSLISLSGLDNLTFIGGDLTIARNSALTSLTGLENITSVPGNLSIGTNYIVYPLGNPSLTSLTGLNNVTSVVGDLIIIDNDSLTSLSGLDNIDAGSIDELEITYNNLLSTCEVQSVCDYLASPGGTIEIHDNATGCNSPEEVEEACDSIISINEIKLKDTFIISPNPLESSAIIEYTLHHNSHVTLKILNFSGRVVNILVNDFQQQGEQKVIFNVIALPPGIYFCVLKTKEGIQTTKIIKL